MVVALCLQPSVFHLQFSTCQAQIGTWRAFMSYYEPQQIVKGGNHLFVRASNDLYSYNLNDQSIITYDKVNGLSDTYITHIAWNDQAQRLIIVYQNQNIDLMDASGEVVNISALYSKSIAGDKTVHDVFINGPYAYLATGFGVVKINMVRAEVSESCILNRNITNVGMDGITIYAKAHDEFTNIPYKTDNATLATGTVIYDVVTERDKNDNPTKKTVIIEALFQIETSQNFIDPNKWVLTTSVPTNVFDKDLTDWNNHLETVKTLQPGGPKYNNFGYMKYLNNKLYTCNGDYNNSSAIQILYNNEWTICQDEGIKELTGVTYFGSYCFDIDPSNDNHIFAGSKNGLYEYCDGTIVNFFNSNNSPIEAYNGKSFNTQLVTGVKFDQNGNLFILNSQAPTTALIKYSNGIFTKINHSELMKLNTDTNYPNKSNGNLCNIIIDSQGLMWFVNDNWALPAFYHYNIDDDKLKSYENFINQDGIEVKIHTGAKCIAEDLDKNIWIGTSSGPFLLERSQINNDSPILLQIKVPRNDGTNYADYLLSGISITSIAIDAAGRKWFGTEDSGVYLISADNMEQLCNFTAENSRLLSNNIKSITINNTTGEVYFGTDMGLCSYVSDATTAQPTMIKDNVYAYPNPVMKDYQGLITIVGLSMDTDVKILSTSGKLIAQGRSNGGTFTWNGRDIQGRRVATGIYMVSTATYDGKKGTICKIAIVN